MGCGRLKTRRCAGVRIARIDLEGFGCLRDFHCEVANGIHIFFGPNESGKSTLQQAIFALLYGFYEGGRARRHETAQHDRYRPWDAGAYAGRLEFEVETGEDKGKRYRVQRDFSSRDVPTTVWDQTTGEDVTSNYPAAQHGAVAFARTYLGMPKSVFDACAFVSQGELFDLANESLASPQEIGDTIISLADSARRDVSAQSAMELLDGVLRAEVGGPRARTTPLPVARGELEQAQAELAEIDRTRSEVASEANQLEEALLKAKVEGEALTRTRHHILQAELADLGTRLEQLGALNQGDGQSKQQLEEHAASAQFPVEERDGVLNRQNTVDNLREQLGGMHERIESARQRAASVSNELEPLQRRAAELEYVKSYPVEGRDAVAGAVATWRNAKLLADEAARRVEEVRVPDELVSEFERLDAAVGDLTSGDVEEMRRLLAAAPPNWFVRALGASWQALGSAMGWLWARAGTAARWLFRRKPAGTERPVGVEEKAAQPPSARREDLAESVRNYERYLDIKLDVQRFLEAKDRSESRGRELSLTEQSARDAFKGLVDDVSNIENAYEAFSDRRQKRQELERIEAQITALLDEAETLRRLIDEYDGERSRLQRLEDALRNDLHGWTKQAGTLEELLAAFEQGCNRRGLYEEAERGITANNRARDLILKGRSRSELEEDVRLREREVQLLEERHAGLRGARTDDSLETLHQSYRDLDGRVGQLEVEIERLRTMIETKLADLRPRADVEEEIERLEGEITALEWFGNELEIAIEVIDQAMTEAHRDFAPSVGRFLSEGFSRITGGRYRDVLLDPTTLKLTTEVPETGNYGDIELLSRGTRAAAYLLLRAGLAQHMSSLGEPVPLILDDPLVDLDDVRLESFLEELLRLSDEIQILLFTKDHVTKEWFERFHTTDPRHDLTVLPGPPATAAT